MMRTIVSRGSVSGSASCAISHSVCSALAVTKVVTVKAEQTLWDIAHEADPETDPRDTIVRIIKLNDLQNTKLQAGQRLEVPAR